MNQKFRKSEISLDTG